MSSSKRPLNLEDIAAKAGVSRSTVSRVINDEPGVKKKTRQKVLAVIKQEGFTPNPVARALVTRRSNVIGVVIPLFPLVFFADSFYFPTLLQGISKAASERDYAMLLYLAQTDEDSERLYRRVVNHRLMDGAIIASATVNEPLIDHFLDTNTPFVLVERPARHTDQISFVSIDNVTAARQLVHHLIVLGRQRIGTITGSLHITDGVDRLEGYRQALSNAGIPIDEHLIVEGDFSHDAGYRGMKKLLPYGVDAVFAANDISARGALQAIHEAGLRVPDDVALVGFDNLPTATQTVPPLTTVHSPVEEKGAQAAAVLFNLIENPGSAVQHILLPTRLVIRESCGGVREHECT